MQDEYTTTNIHEKNKNLVMVIPTLCVLNVLQLTTCTSTLPPLVVYYPSFECHLLRVEGVGTSTRALSGQYVES